MNAEKALALIEQLESFLALHAEVQLADFGETAASGPYFKVRLPDPDELAVFRGKNRANKNKQGTRYIAMLIEIQDDEIPLDQGKRARLEEAEEKKGGALSKNAAMLCKDPQFISYLNNVKPGRAWNEVAARAYVLSVCEIQSRRELDHNQRAAQRYTSFVKGPFLEWVSDGRY